MMRRRCCCGGLGVGRCTDDHWRCSDGRCERTSKNQTSNWYQATATAGVGLDQGVSWSAVVLGVMRLVLWSGSGQERERRGWSGVDPTTPPRSSTRLRRIRGRGRGWVPSRAWWARHRRSMAMSRPMPVPRARVLWLAMSANVNMPWARGRRWRRVMIAITRCTTPAPTARPTRPLPVSRPITRTRWAGLHTSTAPTARRRRYAQWAQHLGEHIWCRFRGSVVRLRLHSSIVAPVPLVLVAPAIVVVPMVRRLRRDLKQQRRRIRI